MADTQLDYFKDVDVVLDYADQNISQKIFAAEGDIQGRTLTVQVTNKGRVSEIIGAVLRAVWKNEATGISDITAFDEIDSSNGLFELTYPSHMMTKGNVKMQIQIVYQGATTMSRPFDITVTGINGNFKTIIESQQFYALITALNEATKANPRDSFNSLSELIAKYPNGETGTYLVYNADTTYHTYMWNGSAWTDKGSYQAKFIDNDSINFNKLSNFQKEVRWFMPESTPVYDPQTLTIDFKADSSNRMLFRTETDYNFIVDNATVTYSGTSSTSALMLLFNVITRKFRLTSYDQALTADEVFVGTIRRDGTKYNLPFLIEVKGAKKKVETSYTNNSKLHMSFDDVSAIFVDLMNKKGTYKSAFDNPFLAKLKIYNEAYNAKFSLYVFLDEFLLMDNTYKKDFLDNADWLKFGFHQKKDVDNYLNTTYEKASSDYSSFISQLYTVCGTYNALDRLPRLQNFSVNEVSAQAMKDNNLGVYGFLTPDDSRNATYLGTVNEDYLRTHDKLYDSQLNLHFFSTDLRLENSASVTSDLNTKLTNYTNADMNKTIVVFSHEYIFYDSNGMKSTSKLDEIMNFSRSNNIVFDFPQNLIQPKEYATNPFKKVEQIQFDFVSGHIDANGNYTTSDTRMRTSYIYIPKNKKLVIDCGNNYSVATYKTTTKANNGLVASAWTSGKQEITSDGKSYYRFSVKRNDDSTAIKNEVDNIKFSLVSN